MLPGTPMWGPPAKVYRGYKGTHSRETFPFDKFHPVEVNWFVTDKPYSRRAMRVVKKVQQRKQRQYNQRLCREVGNGTA